LFESQSGANAAAFVRGVIVVFFFVEVSAAGEASGFDVPIEV
jgi:hypothetical protein